MIKAVESGGLKLIANDRLNKDIGENSLSVGIRNGWITVFDKDGNKITGIRGVEVKTHINDLMVVNIELLINKKFFICDPIKVK